MTDTELERYAEDHTSPEIPLLARLSRETNLTQMYPRMLAGHLQGTFLRMISHIIRPERVLEIGTFTGYSTICLAAGLVCPSHDPSPGRERNNWGNGVIHTIEVDPELEEIIRKYVKEAGVGEKVVLHIGNAIDIIPTLNEQWDLVFIDADKPNYLNYYKMVIDQMRKEGIILADNALWNGKVLEKKPRSKDTLGIIEFNEFVQQDDRVENLLLPIRDGIMMIRKR